MTITKKQDGTNITLELEGRLDTVTSQDLEKEVAADCTGSEALTLDFAQLIYVSSAGLRVILGAHKKLAKGGGKLRLVNVAENVKEVFEMTGFSDFLTIE